MSGIASVLISRFQRLTHWWNGILDRTLASMIRTDWPAGIERLFKFITQLGTAALVQVLVSIRHPNYASSAGTALSFLATIYFIWPVVSRSTRWLGRHVLTVRESTAVAVIMMAVTPSLFALVAAKWTEDLLAHTIRIDVPQLRRTLRQEAEDSREVARLERSWQKCASRGKSPADGCSPPTPSPAK